jgi:hypothetical protein
MISGYHIERLDYAVEELGLGGVVNAKNIRKPLSYIDSNQKKENKKF